MQENLKNNSEISERLRQLIDSLNLNVNSFAGMLGYKRSQAIYDMISGKAKPSFDFFQKLLNTDVSESVDLRWLITGKASYIDSSHHQVVNETHSRYYSKAPPKCLLCEEKERLIAEKNQHIKALECHIKTLTGEGQKRKAC